MDWIAVGHLDDIEKSGARQVARQRGGPIAVFRTDDDEVFAIHDNCPHSAGPLSQGYVKGHTVICPLHSWVIALDTGMVQAPDQGRVACFPAKVEDGAVLLQAPGLGDGASFEPEP
jgi:nitrite reductase (NADH) small subunit